MKYYLDPSPQIALLRPYYKYIMPIRDVARYHDLQKRESKKDINELLEISIDFMGFELNDIGSWHDHICKNKLYVSKLEIESVEKVIKKSLVNCKDSKVGCEIIKNKTPPYLDEIESELKVLLGLSEETDRFAVEIMEFIRL